MVWRVERHGFLSPIAFVGLYPRLAGAAYGFDKDVAIVEIGVRVHVLPWENQTDGMWPSCRVYSLGFSGGGGHDGGGALGGGSDV